MDRNETRDADQELSHESLELIDLDSNETSFDEETW
jgi:hypothetical protein